jgi:hypothetical protein
MAGVRLTASHVNGLLWGHGERPFTLLRNLIILGIVIFPGFLWLERTALTVNGQVPSIEDMIWLSVMTLIPVGGVYTVGTASASVRMILAIESLVGLVLVALFGTLLLRRVLGR